MAESNTSTTATTTYTITAIGWLTVKTDKYSYHPGDFVYIAGEAITPSITWTYTITAPGVGEGLSVKIEIFDPNGNLIKSDNTDPNVAGYKSYAYNFSIKTDAILGIYKIHVSYSLFGNEIEGYGSFYVEKEQSVITCIVSKPIIDIEKGESVMIFGSISPAHSAPVIIEYSLDGEAWHSLTIINSNLDGSFSYVWIPSSTGTYWIRTSWRGDHDHVGSTSYPTEGLELQIIPEFSFYPSIPLLTISLIIAILFMQKYRRLAI